MKRNIPFVLILFVLTSMACSLSGQTGNPPSAPSANESTAETLTLATATIPRPTNTQEQPTSTFAPTETEAPTSVPTDTPTDTPAAPVEFVDTFDRNQNYWSEDFIVTSQTSGRDLYSKGIIQNGTLRFSFTDKETYMYKFFQNGDFANVTVEADFQAIGHINNGIALVCRVNNDRTQWYEARVSSTSDFWLFLYDKARKTEMGKNPYLELAKGKFKIDEFYPAKPNKIQLTCLNDELILNANRDKRVIRQVLETEIEGSGVGIGAMSYDVLPITIDFDKITIREENN